ncbi:hypothetical protein GCM10010431_64220 [Streptomyces kunmingensis]|uniref:hypothetical protein n=1 Tax=Streptomyces kunmingensis TaxID=68225 RepID=UPI00336ECE43
MTTTVPAATDNFARPIEDRYFEEYVPGAVHVFGSSTLTEEDILDFAGRRHARSARVPISGPSRRGAHTQKVVGAARLSDPARALVHTPAARAMAELPKPETTTPPR